MSKQFILPITLLLAFSASVHATVETKTFTIAHTFDDVVATSPTQQNCCASNNYIGDNRTYTAPFQLSGMRFSDIDIPRHALIVDARLQIRSTGIDNRGQVYGTIFAEALDYPQNYDNRMVTDAPLTDASVDWDQKTAWDVNVWYDSPNIAPLIQEVISSDGWHPTWPIAIQYRTRTDSGKMRRYGAYVSSNESAPKLQITCEYHTISGRIDAHPAHLRTTLVSAGTDYQPVIPDESGYYELHVPPGYTGTVAVIKPQMGSIPLERTFTDLNADINEQNFRLFLPEISGKVLDRQGNPVPSIHMYASDNPQYILDTTDSTGSFSFTKTYGWTGTVTFTASNWTFESTHSFTDLTAEKTTLNVEAWRPIISGYIRSEDGTPVKDVRMRAKSTYIHDESYTDDNGYYELMVASPFTGYVEHYKEGYGFDPVEHYIKNLSEDATVNFTEKKLTISGHIRQKDGSPAEGVTLTAEGIPKTVTTDATGYYQFTVPYNFDDGITPQKTDWAFTPAYRNFNQLRQDRADADYQIWQPIFSGHIFGHDNEPLPGVTLTFDNAGTTQTDENGDFSHQLPYGYSGTVTIAKQGWRFTNESYNITNLKSDWAYTFRGTQPRISGIVKRDDQTRLQGATISTSDGLTLTTDSNGSYMFYVPFGWSGTVTCSKSDWAFEPDIVELVDVNINRDVAFQGTFGFGGGDGTVENPYQIKTAPHMFEIGKKNEYWDKHFILVNNVGMNYFDENGKKPVYPVIGTASTPFSGTFEGNGKRISSLLIPQGLDAHKGMFGYIDGDNAAVRNLTLTSPQTKDHSQTYPDYCAALAGRVNNGVVTNCHVSGGTIRGRNYVAGLVAVNFGTISKCSARCTVEGGNGVGGLVGDNFGIIKECFAKCFLDVSITKGYGGGLVAKVETAGQVIRSYATGQLTGNADFNGGGLVGYLRGTVRNCYSSVSYTPYGLIGQTSIQAVIIESFYNNEISPTGNNYGTGLTPQQMQTMQTYLEHGWDFYTPYWKIRNESDYPQLSWEDASLPIMCVDRSLIEMEHRRGHTDDPTDLITIKNAGTEKLEWRVYKLNQWLEVAPFSGTLQQDESIQLVVKANTSQLDYGNHTAQLECTSPSGYVYNIPWMVTVNVNILEPVISTDIQEVLLDIPITDANDFTQTLSISNTGGDTLNWQIEIPADANWLRAEPPTGSSFEEPQVVELIASSKNLPIGYHNTELLIHDPAASNSPYSVPVNLHVYHPGQLHVPHEYEKIQHAIEAAQDGDEIIVHPGKYYENQGYINFMGKAITVRSLDPSDPDIVAGTVINCGFAFHDQEDSRSILDGFSIQPDGYGYSGIECHESSPIIRNCILKNSGTNRKYGHITCWNSSLQIINCEILGNTYGFGGSGISINNLQTQFPDSRHVIIRNCLVSGQMSYYPGVSHLSSSGIIIAGGSAEITNCTVTYNGAQLRYGEPGLPSSGITVRAADVDITNCIITDNFSPNNVQIDIIDAVDYPAPPSRVNVSYSNVQGGQDNVLVFTTQDDYWAYLYEGVMPDPNLADPNTVNWGPGNIDVDPLFVRNPHDGGDGWGDNFETQGIDEGENDELGDLHLQSQTGRYRYDELAQTDLNRDKAVDLIDLAIFTEHWIEPYQGALSRPYDFYYDQHINFRDFGILSAEFLQQRIFGQWITDEATSPCIDAGNPDDPAWQYEPQPNGQRINMGAYGRTNKASKSSGL